MAWSLTNQQKQLLILTLNSGRSLYLAPGERAVDVADEELSDNDKVRKLQSSGAIRIDREQAAPAVGSRSDAAPRPTTAEAFPAGDTAPVAAAGARVQGDRRKGKG